MALGTLVTMTLSTVVVLGLQTVRRCLFTSGGCSGFGPSRRRRAATLWSNVTHVQWMMALVLVPGHTLCPVGPRCREARRRESVSSG